MPNLIGTAPNQVPTNGSLGNMAFQNKEAVSVDTLVTTALTVTGTGALTVGGTQIVKDASGNVGIGTSSPAFTLDVANTVGAGLRVNTTVSGNAQILVNATGGTAILDLQTGAGLNRITGGLGGTSNLAFFTASTERMRIDSSGNLGIGTSSPGDKLTVNGFVSATAGAYSSTNGGNAVKFGAAGQMNFGAGGSDLILTTNAGNIRFGNWNTNTEYARIDSSGNMGIGTTSPTAKLDVNADTVRVRTAKTPASATATGNAGDICWDADYVYVCVATNTWKRSALSTW